MGLSCDFNDLSLWIQEISSIMLELSTKRRDEVVVRFPCILFLPIPRLGSQFGLDLVSLLMNAYKTTGQMVWHIALAKFGKVQVESMQDIMPMLSRRNS